MKCIRIGTRSSQLAMAQTRIVIDALQGVDPTLQLEPVPIVTRGDRTAGPLASTGGKGLFTSEIEQALLRGEIDLAVHSAKDLPAPMSEGLIIAAAPPRGDPADALVSPSGASIVDLPPGAVVATGSLRRRAQVLAARDDLNVVAVRGNVETRVRKALTGQAGPDGGRIDATILAMAGLIRSGLAEEYSSCICPLDAAGFIPAAGQGTLVVQSRAGGGIADLVKQVDDSASRQGLLAERSVLRRLGADCHSCVAVHVFGAAGRWGGRAMVARADGADMVRAEAHAETAPDVANLLLDELRQAGAETLMSP